MGVLRLLSVVEAYAVDQNDEIQINTGTRKITK